MRGRGDDHRLPATAQPDVGYILSDSGSVVVFAENADQVAKVKAPDLPDLIGIVAFDARPADDDVHDAWPS